MRLGQTYITSVAGANLASPQVPCGLRREPQVRLLEKNPSLPGYCFLPFFSAW